MPRADWEFDLKYYPHFDAIMSEESARALATNPKAVASNRFYPFLLRYDGWQPYRRKATGRPDRKERPIRYAARRDAYIYTYYRHLLATPYEKALEAAGLGDCVLAYRRLRDENGSGKSNVEFARDAVLEARRIGRCAAVALDVSSFFESLDHSLLRARWAELLGVDQLPPDHEAVFKSVTRYAVVDRNAAYERLGYIRREMHLGRERLVYTCRKEEMPKKLCSNEDFQQRVCGRGGAYKSLVDVNRRSYGIPQGSPISDLLANIYMFHFDRELADYCRARGGTYYRYSDDILLLLPGGEVEACAAASFAITNIQQHGAKLKIKESKTSITVFQPDADGQSFKHVSGRQGRNGLEYLGFRYDGKEVFLRDATLSRLYRKVISGVRGECAALFSRYPGQLPSTLLSLFDFSRFFQRYGRVDDFENGGDISNWTFWTYARRASQAFGPLGRRSIIRQLRNYKAVVRARVTDEIVKQAARRSA